MTKYSHRWLLSNSKTIDNHIIYPYCHQSEENFDHDHFVACNNSDERKEVRIQRFHLLLTQLQTPIALTFTLIRGLKTAYRKHHQSTSQIPPTPEYNLMEPLHTWEDIQITNQRHDELLPSIDPNQTTIYRHRVNKSRRQIHARNPRL